VVFVGWHGAMNPAGGYVQRAGTHKEALPVSRIEWCTSVLSFCDVICEQSMLRRGLCAALSGLFLDGLASSACARDHKGARPRIVV